MESTSELKRFFCPYDGRQVECVLRVDTATGTCVRLEHCSGLERRVDLHCDQACVRMFNRGWDLDSDGDG